jgi:hypothetical protein
MGVTLRHRAYTSVVVCTQARCLALESHGAELKGALAEATARMERFRKSYKDTGTLRLPAQLRCFVVVARFLHCASEAQVDTAYHPCIRRHEPSPSCPASV